MKKINYLFNKGSLWLVFIISAFLSFCIFFAMFYFLTEIEEVTLYTALRISSVVGVIFGLISVCMTSLGRNSIKFWEAAKILDEKIEQAASKEQIQNLYKNDFMELKKLAGGPPHFSELSRLHAIISTKYKLIK